MSVLKTKLTKSIKNKKLNVFILFFLMAFAFLIISKLSKTYTETVSFKINFNNLPENRVISDKDKYKIDVTLKTIGFKLIPFLFNDKKLIIDFNKDVTESNSSYLWVSNQNTSKIEQQLTNSIDIISIQPDTLKFNFQKLATKKVPIVLNSNITFATGYNTQEKVKLSPDSISIIGSELSLKSISKIDTKKTEFIDVKSDINTELLLLLPENDKSVKLSTNKVKLNAKVEKFTEGSLELPVSVINLPEEITINYFPKTVTVTYNVSLANYKNIKPLDFKVECDFNEVIGSNNTFFTPKLVKQPVNIKSAKIKQNKIEFILIQ
jgi:hypothetical protein